MWLITHKRSSIRLWEDFLSKTTLAKKHWIGKFKGKKSVNKEFYIWPYYPLKHENKIKTFQDKQTYIAHQKAETSLCQQRSTQSKLRFFQHSCTDVRAGLQRRLSAKELMLMNCGAGEDSWRVPGTARRSNQSILREINPEYSIEGLRLKFQYFGHLIWRVNSLEKDPKWGERLKARWESSSRGWDG